MTPEALVRSATAWETVPFVPEIRLLTAAEPFGLWDRTACDAPPFWAFPWAGGQALARYCLDHPGTVRGRRTLYRSSDGGDEGSDDRVQRPARHVTHLWLKEGRHVERV